MATGYTRIGKLLIPYEKPDPKPAPKAKKADPAPVPTPEPEPTQQKNLLETAAVAVSEVVKPKRRRGRPKKDEE